MSHFIHSAPIIANHENRVYRQTKERASLPESVVLQDCKVGLPEYSEFEKALSKYKKWNVRRIRIESIQAELLKVLDSKQYKLFEIYNTFTRRMAK